VVAAGDNGECGIGAVVDAGDNVECGVGAVVDAVDGNCDEGAVVGT
jgi:hypothetical protein